MGCYAPFISRKYAKVQRMDALGCCARMTRITQKEHGLNWKEADGLLRSFYFTQRRQGAKGRILWDGTRIELMKTD